MSADVVEAGDDKERACGLDDVDAEEGGRAEGVGVDEVDGVDVRGENSIRFVVEDAGDAGEGDEQGFVRHGVGGFDYSDVELKWKDWPGI